MPSRNRRIPGKSEWLGFESDLDVKYAHKLMFGKSIADVLQYFGGTSSIERADELLFMPRGAFQYYVFAFAKFVQSDTAAGDADSASPFLLLLASREERDPGSVSEIYSDLAPAIEYVATHQSSFDADPNIYGDFRELGERIKVLCAGTDS
jgi:hypothetical protein